jgi:hypothetical protein
MLTRRYWSGEAAVFAVECDIAENAAVGRGLHTIDAPETN